MKEEIEIDQIYNPSGFHMESKKSEYELGEKALMGHFNFAGEESDRSYKFSDRMGNI